jgi:ankyrin repeat protein
VLAVKQMIADGEELNRRDQVGRTPLHLAIFSHSVEVGCALVDAGARINARLIGGRNSLHLAAQMGQASLVQKILERNAYNKENVPEDRRKIEDEDVCMSNEDEDVVMSDEDEDVVMSDEDEDVCMSSEDDWSSSSEEYDDGKPHHKRPAYTKKDEPEKISDPLEDNEEEPDILDISIRDWDLGFTALAFAILSGSLEIVEALLAAGADPGFVTYAKKVNPLHPLALTIYTQDEERAAKIAERLIAAQAISSTADGNLFTTFHRIVAAGKTKIVASLLAHDANAKKVINGPTWCGDRLLFPIVSTIMAGDYATLSLLLAHGAKLSYSPEDVSRAEDKRYAQHPLL